jgi:hypothetical protein
MAFRTCSRCSWLFLLAPALALAIGCSPRESETSAPLAASQPTEEVAPTRPDDRLQKIAELKDLAWTHRNRIESRLEALRVHGSETEGESEEYDRAVEALDRLLEELQAEVEEKIAAGHAKLDGLAVELAAERVRVEALRPLVPSDSARAARDSWRAWHRTIEEQRENIAKRRAVAEQYPDRYPPGHEDLGKRRYNPSR